LSALAHRRTVLLTLGRLPKSVELIRGFSAQGFRVLVAEPHPWHLSRISNQVDRSFEVVSPVTEPEGYLRQLHDIVTRERVELVVPISEETMHASGLKARLPTGATMFCPDQRTLLELHDKFRFIELARPAEVAVPETVALGDPQARRLAEAGPFVVKPRFSCSGRGVEFFEKGAPLPTRNEPCVVQAKVEGQVLSTFSVVRDGRVLITVVYRGLVMAGTVSVCFEQLDFPAIDRWVERFAAHHRYSGFLSFDFVVDESGTPFGIECNPRITSGVHFVEPADLAAAMIAGPTQTPIVRLRPQRTAQQFYPTLTETERAFLKGEFAKARRSFLAMWRARDVVWSWRDPLPFLTMPLTAWRILSHAIRKGTSLGEASTFDIEWYGTPPEAQGASAPMEVKT
jgi:hypothetical protein